MPEGNVIHFQARKLAGLFDGRRVRIDSPQGRFAEGAALVDRRTVRNVEAVGKHLFIDMANGLSIHVHLGLFGKWRFGKGRAPDPKGLIRMRIQSSDAYAELRGPTQCEVVTPAEKDELLARIGPDPIRADADPERAWRRIARSQQPIGALLMDQRTISGVGNIYRAEVLFRHGVSPFTPGRSVPREIFDAMWVDLVELMRKGTKRGRIDTVREEHLPEVMGRAARKDRHGGEVYIYRRHGQRCYLCGEVVQMQEMQSRKLYWCAGCQAP